MLLQDVSKIHTISPDLKGSVLKSMNRLKIIQKLIDINNAKSYLEIGVNKGHVINNIQVDYKIGVDPDNSSKATIFTTSDDFFINNKEKFDIIFIDGLHHAEQVEKDIINSLLVLNDGGYVICHDMLPTNKETQMVPRMQFNWTGDCWKAWVKLRSYRSDLKMFVVDADYGCGIVQYGKQELINISNKELSYENFLENKFEWMNIIDIETFKKLVKQRNIFI